MRTSFQSTILGYLGYYEEENLGHCFSVKQDNDVCAHENKYVFKRYDDI